MNVDDVRQMPTPSIRGVIDAEALLLAHREGDRHGYESLLRDMFDDEDAQSRFHVALMCLMPFAAQASVPPTSWLRSSLLELQTELARREDGAA